ncbi:MAG TPA: glycosyltransferase [Acidimicrobiales bacterium]|nr:glycosyltransferase [Acidimicrobiales bacterium]
MALSRSPSVAARSSLGSRSEVDRRIRVLWLTKGLGPGGTERLLVTSARRHDRQVLVLRAGYLLPHKVALVGELEAEGIPVTCLGHSQVLDPRWLVALRRSLVREPVDIVHAHNPTMAVGARIVARSLPRRLRPRVVVTDHGVWQGYVPVTRWADALTSGLDDARLAVSETVRASLPAPIHRRSVAVPQGVEVERLRAQRDHRAATRAKLGIDPGTLVVGTVANLRPVKAYPDLLDAAFEVVDRLPNVRFVLVGQGPQEAEIRALHARMGLGDRVLLLGHRPDAVRLMAGFDVFVLSSLHEGLPVALMEALALGLPVVATDVGGIPELVEHGREGLLVPPGRPPELATALVTLLTDAGRRRQMAEAAGRRGEALSIDTAVRQTEAVYHELAMSGTARQPATASGDGFGRNSTDSVTRTGGSL